MSFDKQKALKQELGLEDDDDYWPDDADALLADDDDNFYSPLENKTPNQELASRPLDQKKIIDHSTKYTPSEEPKTKSLEPKSDLKPSVSLTSKDLPQTHQRLNESEDSDNSTDDVLGMLEDEKPRSTSVTSTAGRSSLYSSTPASLFSPPATNTVKNTNSFPSSNSTPQVTDASYNPSFGDDLSTTTNDPVVRRRRPVPRTAAALSTPTPPPQDPNKDKDKSKGTEKPLADFSSTINTAPANVTNPISTPTNSSLPSWLSKSNSSTNLLSTNNSTLPFTTTQKPITNDTTINSVPQKEIQTTENAKETKTDIVPKMVEQTIKKEFSDNPDTLKSLEESIKERSKLVSKLEEAQQKSLLIKEEQQILSTKLKFSSEKHESEIGVIQSQYEDKLLALTEQLTKQTKEHIEEKETIKQKYEQRITEMEQLFKKEKQVMLQTEGIIRRQLEEIQDKLNEQKRTFQKEKEEYIEKLNMEKEEAVRIAEKKIQEEKNYSIALHKDALDAKEHHFNQIIEQLKRTHHQELQSAMNQKDSQSNITELMQQVQASTTALKSMQKQLTNELSIGLEEREMILRQREKDIEKKEDQFNRQQKDMEREQKSLQSLMSKMEQQLRDFQYNNEEEKRKLYQETKQLEARRHEFEIEIKTIRENLEKEQRRVQLLREEKIKEKENFLAETLEERRAIAEERRLLEDSKRRFSENDEIMLRRVREKESALDAEKSRVSHDRNEFLLEKDSFQREKERIIKDRLQLQTDIEAFQQQTAELTKLGFDLQQRSGQVSQMHETALNERLQTQQLRDEAQAIYNKLEMQKIVVEEKESKLIDLQKSIDKQRVDLAKERKQLQEEREESAKIIGSAKAFTTRLLTQQPMSPNLSNSRLLSEFVSNKEEVSSNKENYTRVNKMNGSSIVNRRRWDKEREEATINIEQQEKFLSDMQSSNYTLKPISTILNLSSSFIK